METIFGFSVLALSQRVPTRWGNHLNGNFDRLTEAAMQAQELPSPLAGEII